jgi:hypothetical protein
MTEPERFVIDIHPERVDVTDVLTEKAVHAFTGTDRLSLAEKAASRLNELHEIGLSDPTEWFDAMAPRNFDHVKGLRPQTHSSAPLAETLPAQRRPSVEQLRATLAEVEAEALEMIRDGSALLARVTKIRETLDRPTPEAEKSASVAHSGPGDVLCGNRGWPHLPCEMISGRSGPCLAGAARGCRDAAWVVDI